MELRDLTDTQQDYLEAIFMLSEEKRDGVQLVDAADKLAVRPSSAIEVVARLKDMGLLSQQRRDKILLTGEGARLGGHITARHMTIRNFFTDVLRLPPELAEEDACKVEHALGPATYDRLCDFLEHLDFDDIERDHTVPLTLMNKGEKGTLKRIVGGAGKVRRLAAMGVRVGSQIQLLQNNRGGPVMVKSGESRVAIGRGLGTCLHVAPAKG